MSGEQSSAFDSVRVGQRAVVENSWTDDSRSDGMEIVGNKSPFSE
jgi:hypothetical protein